MLEILDPLYGRFELPDFARDIMNTPELQRLSEIRLMNVSGWTMPAATTTTRLEHALGVAHLAYLYSRSNSLGTLERNNLILGCLIHDVASFPYGHLVEGIFKRFFPGSPSHSQRLLIDIFNNKEDLQIYRGTHCRLYRRLLAAVDLFGRPPILAACLVLGSEAVRSPESCAYDDHLPENIVAELHRLIDGPMDLDNIDNVFRIADRFGLSYDNSAPERLASSISLHLPMMQIREENLRFVQEWQRLRADVYEIFFTHPDILATKALLSYCVESCLKSKILLERHWVLTDNELLELFLGFTAIKDEARQLLLGTELICHCRLICRTGNMDQLISQLNELREDVASNLMVEDLRRRKTDSVLALERECGSRRLFVTAERDKGASSRRCEFEVFRQCGNSETIALGEDSDRLIISALLPVWCRARSEAINDVLLDAIAHRTGCATVDICHFTTSKPQMKSGTSQESAGRYLFQ